MLRVLSLRQIADTDPQEFELVYKDLKNAKSTYLWASLTSTEAAVREMLLENEMSESDIDKLFHDAAWRESQSNKASY